MVFSPASWLPDITERIPNNVNVGDFVLEGRRDEGSSRLPLVCATTGRTYTLEQMVERVGILAAALRQDLGWFRKELPSTEKVVGVMCLNSIDFLIFCWAVHRIGGTCLLLQPTTAAVEVVSHMGKAPCKALIVCEELLSKCKEIFTLLPEVPEKIYSIDEKLSPSYAELQLNVKSLPQLIQKGRNVLQLHPLWWCKEGEFNDLAFLCSTSGTSGRQRLARITHENVIANILQAAIFERAAKGSSPRIGLGILPLSHGFGLVITQAQIWRGDTTVLHTTFNMQAMLTSVQKYRIERLYLVPPVVAALAANPILFKLFDLSSVKDIVMGAAACSEGLSQKIHASQPKWQILAGYGLTECTSPVTWTPASDIVPGSSGMLLPSVQARLLDASNKEIDQHDVPGELYLKSPSRVPGYLGESEEENANFVIDGWLPTGDIGLFRKGADSNEHLFLVDRVKDMIKVKGLQVSPSAIEDVLRTHPDITDASVVGVEDAIAGERPLAFVIASKTEATGLNCKVLIAEVDEYVKSQLDETHWLRNRIWFVKELPKSQTGKTLKAKLRHVVREYGLTDGTGELNAYMPFYRGDFDG